MADRRSKLAELALDLPGAQEDFPWGERVVNVRRRVFVFPGAELDARGI